LLNKYNEFEIDKLKIRKGKILFIFPHPDDETMISGGLIASLANKKEYEIEVVTATMGEKGDEIIKKSPEQLAKIREKEFIQSMKILGVENYSMWDYGDGELENQKSKLRKRIQEKLKEEDYDTVVTYEPGGVYPHPDHIVLSKTVTRIVKDKEIDLIYATLPKAIRELADLPNTISLRGKEVKLENVEHKNPKLKYPIWRNLIKKYRAAKSYKSQKLSGKFPLIVQMMFMPTEYYVRG
jgi:LmbE family N-acetylglucosaminyl deacetylase